MQWRNILSPGPLSPSLGIASSIYIYMQVGIHKGSCEMLKHHVSAHGHAEAISC